MNDSQIPLKRNWILAALMLTTFLSAMDITIVSTVIPEIVEDVGGFKKFSWVFSIYLLTQTATIPVYGKLSDLYGRKIILLIGITLFLTGSILCASAQDIDMLIFYRAVQGLGGGSIMATVNTIAGDIYTVKERAKVEGYLSSIWGISAIIGPVIGGSLAQLLSWRWIFWVNVPIGIAGAIIIFLYFKEKITKQKVYVDYAGAISIFCLLAVLITFLLNGGQSWPWLSMPSLLLFAGILLFTVTTIYFEKNAHSPILPGWILTERAFIGSNLAALGLGIIMMGPTTYLPTFMQASLGAGIIISGLVLACNSIGWPIASTLSGKLYLTIGFRNTELLGVALMFISCLLFLFIPWPQPTYLLVMDMILMGGGFGLLSTPTLIGIQSVVKWDKRGVVTGANQFGRYLGQSLGAAIFAAIFNGSYAESIAQSKLPVSSHTEDLIAILNDSKTTDLVKQFVKEALNSANKEVFYGMILFCILTFFAVLIVPKKLNLVKD